ncbi:transcriptional regulator GlcC [Actinomadura vinacea]|uniref:Transcriptional regulator GlcC n=1 Tax=Actinomadura vinacea TaxID=115336 RepID=A0ABP5XFC3_9ACTN
MSGAPETRATVALSRGCMDIAVGDAATRRLKTSETVARDIVHDMVEEGLRTGDRMPSETAMLERYGVSRESLREGLRLLEVQGLITIRRGPGGGPVVGQIDPANLGRTATLYYHLAGATYHELFDAWVLMDSMLAELAARNADRATARKALEPFLEATATRDDDPTAFFEAHAHFHSAIAGLAGNRVLELTFQTPGLIVSHHVMVTADPRDLAEVLDHDHAMVAKAIMSGHPRKAGNEMAAHIRNVTGYYRNQNMDGLIDWR